MAEMTTGKLDKCGWVSGYESPGRLGRLAFTDGAGVFRTIWLPEAEVRLLHTALSVMLDPPKGRLYKIRSDYGKFWSATDGWTEKGTVYSESQYQELSKSGMYMPTGGRWVEMDPSLATSADVGTPEIQGSNDGVARHDIDADEATRRGGVIIVSHTATAGMERCAGNEPKRKLPDPGPDAVDGTNPAFEAIWKCIKSWDVNVPEAYVGYCGATGNHVQAILDALLAEQMWFLRDIRNVDDCVSVTFWNREPYTFAVRSSNPSPQPMPSEDGGEYYLGKAESFVRLTGGYREMERHDQPGTPRNIFIDDQHQSKAESIEQMQASVAALLGHECRKAAGQALYELLTKAQEFIHVPEYPGLPDVDLAWFILKPHLECGVDRCRVAERYHRKGGSPQAVVWALQWRWNLPGDVRPPEASEPLKDGMWLVWTHDRGTAALWTDEEFRGAFEPYVEPPAVVAPALRYYRARDIETGKCWNAREGQWSAVGTLYSENDRRHLPDPRMNKDSRGDESQWVLEEAGVVYQPAEEKPL